MILDKLLEKKDLMNYIGLRIEHIKNIDITKYPEAEREFVGRQLRGRISELVKMKQVIHQNNVKRSGKVYWREIAERDEEQS